MPPLTTPLRPATDDRLDRAVAAGVARGQLPLAGYGVVLLAASAALGLVSGPLALGVGAAVLTLLELLAAQPAACISGHGPLCPHRLPRQRGEDVRA